MSFFIFVMSGALIFACLAVVLHLQFGLVGIANFGVVGFWGLGSYGTGVLTVEYELPVLVALVLATALTGVIAGGLGWIVLDLDNQSVLVATLAFATIVTELIISESQITRGVSGLGTVPFPIDAGDWSDDLLAGFLVVLLIALVLYARRLPTQPYGRLLLAIRDNESLAQGIGKPTSLHKVFFFTVTAAVMGLLGGLNASLDHFLTPSLLTPSVTFTVWIALILGGKSRAIGAVLGVAATVVLFDVLIETYIELPNEYAILVPNIKLFVYGLVLMALLLWRPTGLLGDRSRAETA